MVFTYDQIYSRGDRNTDGNTLLRVHIHAFVADMFKLYLARVFFSRSKNPRKGVWRRYLPWKNMWCT